jgi:hypothetical protein
MKTYGGEAAQPHSVLTFKFDGGEWSTSHCSYLIPRKETQYPLKRRLGGPWGLSEHFGEDRNLLPLLAFKLWIVQPAV